MAIEQLIINCIIGGAIYSLIAMGFGLINSTTKFFNISHGAVFVAGGYFSYLFTDVVGWPVWLSVLIGSFGGAILGVLFWKIIFQNLKKRKSSPVVMFIASLGIFTFFEALMAMVFSPQYKVFSYSQQQNIFHFSNGVVSDIQIYIIIFSFLSLIFLLLFLNKTKIGKTIKAHGDDEEVAKIIGINTEKNNFQLFFIGSFLAALAGTMIGLDVGLRPTMGMFFLLRGVVASIVGGAGSVLGVFIGAFLIGGIENITLWKLSGEWRDAVIYTILILFLIFKPEGLIKK